MTDCIVPFIHVNLDLHALLVKKHSVIDTCLLVSHLLSPPCKNMVKILMSNAA